MELKIEPPNNSNHPPQFLQLPLPSSFLSLPDDIVLNCLARISKSYYPKLSLVSKSFRSLLISRELYNSRSHLKTQEECVFLGLKSHIHPCLIWFSLEIKPDDQTLTQCTIKDKSTGNLLVPIPSSYPYGSPSSKLITVGSELYMIGSQNSYSSAMLVYKGKWCEAPSMMVARKEALTCVMDRKIYVMGGCQANESTYWGEVFDPKTQSWKPLPDPGPEVRFSSNKKLLSMNGKMYVMIKKKNKKHFVYLPKENKWDSVGRESCKNFVEIKDIENVLYSYAQNKCCWYETTSKKWRVIQGLSGLDAYVINDIEIGSYGRNLIIFWDSVAWSPLDQTKEIWCAVILLDKSLDGEVWGQIEWIDVVLTVPRSYTLLSCVNLLA